MYVIVAIIRFFVDILQASWSNARTFGEWQKIVCSPATHFQLSLLTAKKSLGKLRDDRTLVLRDLRQLLEDPVMSEELGIYGGTTEIDDMLRVICPTRPAHPLDSAPDRQDEMYGQGRAMHVQEQVAQAWPTMSYGPQEESDHLSSIDVGNFTGWTFGGPADAPVANPTDRYQTGWQGFLDPEAPLANDAFGHSTLPTTSQYTDILSVALQAQIPAAWQYQLWQTGPPGEPALDRGEADRSYLDNAATGSVRQESGVPALTPGQISDSNSTNPYTPLPLHRAAPSSPTSFAKASSYLQSDFDMFVDLSPDPSDAQDKSPEPDDRRRPSTSSNASFQEYKRVRQTSPEPRDRLPLIIREDLQSRESEMTQRILRQLAAGFSSIAEHVSRRSRIKDFLLNVGFYSASE